MDRDKLSKLMALTTSTNDHEALSALRMANKMLTTEKVTWGEILAAGRITMQEINITVRRQPMGAAYSAEESWEPPHLRDRHVIGMMFRTIYATPRTGNENYWQFMDSVHHWFQTYGRLSQKQYDAVRRAYTHMTRTTPAAPL